MECHSPRCRLTHHREQARSHKGGLCQAQKTGRPCGRPAPLDSYRCDSAYSARIERGTPCRVMCTPFGKSLKRSVR
ncbi:hypothetical protein DOZ80_00760 [Pseudomonas fluorescens]|uniref:Uncharacterized protein n=1 Tax=Pseudomonas fluorescens TaxID=294 RepID=A0A327NHU2_PSEFL|nr:hypothetical protein DOZ80_00760 [Pseudomonas fluorescens]